MSIETLNDLKQSRLELADELRQVEADAFAVMRHRPTFFALKLLFGIGHQAKPEPIEEEPEREEEPLMQTA